MPLADLNETERGVVRECLRAAAEGPFFPDWEFSIIFGLTRDELRQILDTWPDLDEAKQDVVRAINNSMNNLLGYPHRASKETWSEFISVAPQELAVIFARWKQKSPTEHYKARSHFENMM